MAKSHLPKPEHHKQLLCFWAYADFFLNIMLWCLDPDPDGSFQVAGKINKATEAIHSRPADLWMQIL